MPTKKQAVAVPPTDWAKVFKTLPTDILDEEQKRRLALKKKVTEIPDKVLNAEIKRRVEEAKNRPIEWIE